MRLPLLVTAAFGAFGLAIAGPTEEAPTDICLMICYFQQPNCTEPSYPKKSGDCWTCCNPAI
ncbi:hypothetical protein BDV59DRAFT_173591 [Aspergillus ambiguus]|uniref:uncharacterized protein n=1 Tax=Aspergillus ambiguus TaxID=176160 RepID=UPI003CCDC1A2